MAVIERVAAYQGWPLRGVPLYDYAFPVYIKIDAHNQLLLSEGVC